MENNVLETIQNYLSHENALRMKEHIGYLKIKLSKINENIRKCQDKSEEALCREINWQAFVNLRKVKIYIELLAFEGRLGLAEKLSYYASSVDRNTRYTYESKENYLHEFNEENMYKNIQESLGENRLYNAYNWCFFYHRLDPYLKDGVRILFDDPETIPSQLFYEPNCIYDANEVLLGVHILMNLGLYERARQRMDVLKKYLAISKSQSSKKTLSYSQRFAPMIDFEENIIAARSAGDMKIARNYAAQAIMCHLETLVANFFNEDYGRIFLCSDLTLPLSIAIAFDFDPSWARSCIRALFDRIDDGEYFHPVFQKIMDFDVWMRQPEEFGALSTEKMVELEEMNKEKWYKKYK